MRILFCCMGNICRSPTAEGVVRARLEAAGLGGRVDVASAGTHAHHMGSRPDKRALEVAAALNDLVLIAGRKEDPDSLFFQRRLRIEGDTELGLELKNLLDGLDLDSLPGLVKLALADLATFVQDGLQPASAA